MEHFRAYRVREQGKSVYAGFEELTLDDLTPGDVVIRAHYSSLNYKDALAVTGKGKILRRFPLVAGVDVAGEVVSSSDMRFAAGDHVLVTGCGLGEDHDGGFSEIVRVPADWVVPLPEGLSLFEAMAIGTAGFTAALALDRLENNGLQPGLQSGQGPVIVTGASGGVGSIALDLLSGQGYETVALTGKEDANDYLRSIGANEIINRHAIEMGKHPLEKAQWAAAIDNVGGETLAWLTRTVQSWGSIASIGLAGGHELHTTVMPFILRGVSVLGITSANCPMDWRKKIWQRLATDLRPAHLEQIVSKTITFDDLPEVFDSILSGQHRGRVVVQIAGT
jgi:NADPH2:quinone reductase